MLFIILLARAGPHIQAALKATPNNRSRREFRREILRLTADVRASLGDRPGAAAAEELVRFGLDPAADRFEAARTLARCAPDGSGAFADRAVALLREAADRGFANPAALRGEEFAALRGRDEFGRLLREMELVGPLPVAGR